MGRMQRLRLRPHVHWYRKPTSCEGKEEDDQYGWPRLLVVPNAWKNAHVMDFSSDLTDESYTESATPCGGIANARIDRKSNAAHAPTKKGCVFSTQPFVDSTFRSWRISSTTKVDLPSRRSLRERHPACCRRFAFRQPTRSQLEHRRWRKQPNPPRL